jgi:hypothetical protein
LEKCRCAYIAGIRHGVLPRVFYWRLFMKLIEVGTPVVVSLYGHESSGMVLNVIDLPYTPLRSRSRTLYVVKNRLTLREGIAFAVPASVFVEINGKPNPDFKEVKY